MIKRTISVLAVVTAFVAMASAGDFTKEYFGATGPGAWSFYRITAKDGGVSTYHYERKADVDGRVVLELKAKFEQGTAAGTDTKTTYTMPAGFNLARDGMSYGKFTDKMTMQYGSMEMPVDAATLEIIRKAEKDYRGNVSFEATETVGGLSCDRYAYSLKSDGPAATRESGTLWLNDTVPFAVVRHVGKVVNADGTVAAEFDMTLQERGQIQGMANAPLVEQEIEKPATPTSTTLVEGFKAGQVGLEVKALKGGRELQLTLLNKTEAQLTVKVQAGNLDLAVATPLETLSITSAAQSIDLDPGASSHPLTVKQRGPRGMTEGNCSLSVYEGTPIFTGSVTMDQLPR